MTPQGIRCPRCGSDDVRGGKVTLDRVDPSGDGWIHVSVREFGCLSCGLFESRRTDDPGWVEWANTWDPYPPRKPPPPEPEPPDPGGPYAVPTPAPFAALLTTARRDVEAAGEPPAAARTWWRPLPLVGLPGQEPAVAFAAPPEFVPFAELDGHRCGYTGDLGSGHAYLGWIVPAPDLRPWDHPVGFVDEAEPAVVHQLGHDTRSGFERYIELLIPELRQWPDRQATHWDRMATWNLVSATFTHLDTLVRPLGIKRGWSVNPGPWRGTLPAFETPPGWRHERGIDQVGVLAPGDAFAAAPPDLSPEHEARGPADAERLLDAGAPASALLLIKDVFARSEQRGRRFGELRPLWARAYTDLGRPELHARLDAMAHGFAPGPGDTESER